MIEYDSMISDLQFKLSERRFLVHRKGNVLMKCLVLGVAPVSFHAERTTHYVWRCAGPHFLVSFLLSTGTSSPREYDYVPMQISQ